MACMGHAAHLQMPSVFSSRASPCEAGYDTSPPLVRRASLTGPLLQPRHSLSRPLRRAATWPCRASLQHTAVLDTGSVQRVSPAPELSSGYMHGLSNGLRLEVLHQAAVEVGSGAVAHSARPPLLFIHGAGHGAWCWQEHFMPYFGQHGYECFAVSMRSHGGSDTAGTADGYMADQISDLASVIASLPQPPILVAHSLGGIVAQKYLIQLSHGERLPRVAAAALLTNAGLRKFMPSPTWFAEQPSILHAALVFWWMIKKPFHDRRLVKKMLFSSDLPASDFERYHQHFKTATTAMPIRGSDLSGAPPTLGRSPLPPVWVMGAGEDAIIMPHQIHDAADFFGTEAVLMPGIAHDVMLVRGNYEGEGCRQLVRHLLKSLAISSTASCQP